MLKCRKVLVVLIIHLIMIITLTSCNDYCNHAWSDATCERCSKPDENYVSELISFVIDD